MTNTETKRIEYRGWLLDRTAARTYRVACRPDLPYAATATAAIKLALGR